MKIKKRKQGMWGIVLIGVLTAAALITFWIWGQKFYFFGKDNVYSKECIETSLRMRYEEENFKVLKKECDVKKEEEHYKFTVHFLMSDGNGMQFDAYQYERGAKRNSGRTWGDYYSRAADNLGPKRLEKYLENKYDLGKYRTWDRLADDETAYDYTVVYSGQNSKEVAEVISQIYMTNQNVQGKAPVNCEITDTDGKRLWIYGYQSFSDELKEAGIQGNIISDVQKYIEEKMNLYRRT